MITFAPWGSPYARRWAMVMETRARGYDRVAERTRGREKAARNNAGAAPSAASQVRCMHAL